MSEKKFPPDPSEKADVLLSNKAINSQNMSYAVCFPSNTMYIYNFQGRNSHLSSVQSCYQISFSLQVLLSAVSIMSFAQQYHGIYQWDGPWISWKHLTLGFCLSLFFSFLFFLYNNNGESCVLRIVCFFGSLFWLSIINLSTFFCLSRAGQGGCNLSRKAQTSHSPPTSSSVSGGTPSRSQASREI